MASWAKDAREFTVSITPQPRSYSHITTVPKPIVDMLGDPHRITFRIRDDGLITVERAASRERRRRTAK